MMLRVRFFHILAIVTQFLKEREPNVFQGNRKLPHSLNHENEKAVRSHPIQGCEHLRYSAILMLAVVGHLLACCLSRVLNASF
jgi:hypothetical protein